MYDVKRKLDSVGKAFFINYFDILSLTSDTESIIELIKKRQIENGEKLYTEKAYRSRLGHFKSIVKHEDLKETLNIILLIHFIFIRLADGFVLPDGPNIACLIAYYLQPMNMWLVFVCNETLY